MAHLPRTGPGGYRQARFAGAHLKKGQFAGAKCEQADFTRAVLDQADLSHARVSGARFADASFALANLHCLDAANADFQGADLRRARRTDSKRAAAEAWTPDAWPEKETTMPASSPVYSLLEVAPEEDGPFVTPRTRLAAMAGRNRNGTVPSQADPLQAGELCRGHVLSSEDRDIRVVLEDGAETPARRAAGCLLRPEPGDTVLVHRPEAGEAYVLCVLDKAVQAAVLDAPGTLRIEAFERLDLAAPEVRLRGKTGRLEFLDLTLLARTLTAKAGRIAGIAAAVDSTIGDLTQTIRLAVRQVETEVVRAGGIRQFIRERFLVRAGRAAVVAEDEVTVDARKIHLG